MRTQDPRGDRTRAGKRWKVCAAISRFGFVGMPDDDVLKHRVLRLNHVNRVDSPLYSDSSSVALSWSKKTSAANVHFEASAFGGRTAMKTNSRKARIGVLPGLT